MFFACRLLGRIGARKCCQSDCNGRASQCRCSRAQGNKILSPKVTSFSEEDKEHTSVHPEFTIVMAVVSYPSRGRRFSFLLLSFSLDYYASGFSQI
jgi:hypothetical protein